MTKGRVGRAESNCQDVDRYWAGRAPFHKHAYEELVMIQAEGRVKGRIWVERVRLQADLRRISIPVFTRRIRLTDPTDLIIADSRSGYSSSSSSLVSNATALPGSEA